MLLNLALLVAGITGSYSQTTHTVQVGPSGLLVYEPASVSATPGDTVRYCFNPKNHSVTSANFNAPCQWNGVFDSDLTPIAAGSPEDCAHHFDVPVPDSKPIWFYCKQPNGQHCQHGMVGAINPPTTGNTLEAFQQAAEALLNATTTSAVAPPTITPPPAGTDAVPPPASAPTTHTITVGAGHQKVFDPANITAAQGDMVVFHYLADNHTATASSFDSPCDPLAGGFDSGFENVNPSNPNPVTFNITVNDTKPIWGYCRQVGHCPKFGMVFAVNALKDGPMSFENFRNVALALGNSTNSTSPGSGGSSSVDTSGALSTKSVSWAMIGLFAATMAMF